MELISTLQNSRETEEETKVLIESNKTLRQRNNLARESFRYVGYIASILYFAIYDLNKINIMYQFSLESYIGHFKAIIEKWNTKTGIGDGPKERIKVIDQKLRRRIYKFCCTGIFERDKLLLSLQLAAKLAPIDEERAKLAIL